MEPREKIVIVGFGWVGQANGLALAQMGYAVSFYDPMPPKLHYEHSHGELYRRIESLAAVLAKDSPDTWYVVSVGDRVAEDGVQDISLIEKALESLKGAKGHVILRSTVIPSSLEKLHFDFYVPEFLHEKKAVEECIVPYYFVVGRKNASLKEPSFFAMWESKALRTFRGTPKEASHIKYLSNLWNTVRIAFVNEFGSTIADPMTKEGVAEIERVTRFLFEDKPYLRYGRSFGGHCLPKDTRAYLHFAEGEGNPAPILRSLLEANKIHQAVEHENPHLTEWFSEWQRPALSGWVALQSLIGSLKRNALRPFAAMDRRKIAKRS